MATVIAPLFHTGTGEQAVCIPLAFSFQADRVEISRNADGDLLIRPLPANPRAVMVAALQDFAGGQGSEFAAALQEEGQAAVPVAPPGTAAT